MNLRHIQKMISKRHKCGEFVIPDSIDISKADSVVIDDIVKILEHKRFNHKGWINYDFYKTNAAYFIVQYLKGKI